MFVSNPFDRTFSGAPSHSNVSTYTYQRHYFPKLPQKVVVKPGFLVQSQAGLPTISCDMRSPYSSLSYQKQSGSRLTKSYVQNPFYKSHLLEDSQNPLYNSSSTSNFYSYSNMPTYNYNNNYTGTLAESRVTPVYTNSNEQQNKNDFSKKRSNDSNKANTSKLEKKNSNSYQNLGNQAQKYNPYNYQPKPATTGTLKKSHSLGSGNGLNRNQSKQVQKKQSLNSNSQYIPLNEQYVPAKPDSYINKVNRISQHPSQDNDDPLSYNLPSFNSKMIHRPQSLQSPTFKTRFSSQQYNKKNDSIGYQNHDYNQPRQTKTTGVGRNINAPKTINFEGKTFYFVNVDEL